LIQFDNAGKVFQSGTRRVVAVADLSLRVEQGKTLCLIGTSGSGKTTALKMVNRLVPPSSGRVLVNGRDAAELDPIRLRRSMGYVIQKGGLFPHLTVAGNIGMLCRLEGWPRDRILSRVHELLALVNLPPDEFAQRLPHELSGGQQQRVGVARALALDPAIVLMDEPFGALDPITREGLHEEFRRLEQTVKKTILLVTHDLAEAFKLGDRVAIMSEGRLLQVGTENDLKNRPVDSFVASFVGSAHD